MTNKPDVVTNIHGFLSYNDAEAHRNKLMHKDLYGLYCIYVDEENLLWAVMPIKVLDAVMAFNEFDEVAAAAMEVLE